MKGVQEVTRTVSGWFEGDKTPDAVDLLQGDHRKVENLFGLFFNARVAARKKQLLDQIIKELSVHATVEEDLVYPLLQDCCGKQTGEKAQESEEEHHLLKMALSELADMPIESKLLKPKVKVVQELVKHHIKEEETNLLPKLQSSGDDLQRLGKEIEARKDKLMRGIEGGGASASAKSAAPGRKKVTSAKQATSTRRGAGSAGS